MAQWRGVFIAPSTINHRAHQRSKSQPDLSLSQKPQYKSEHSHYPRRGSFGTLCSQAAPSLPCLSKVVTLEFRQVRKEGGKKTSRYAILCNPDISKPEEKEQSKHTFPSCNTRGNSPDLDKPRKNRKVNEESSAEEEDTTGAHCAPLTKSQTNPGAPEKVNSLLGISTSFVSDVDKNQEVCFVKEKEQEIQRVKVKAGEIPVKKELTFRKIVHPEGLVRSFVSSESLIHRIDNDNKAIELKPEKTIVEERKDNVEDLKFCNIFPVSEDTARRSEDLHLLEASKSNFFNSQSKEEENIGLYLKDLKEEFESTTQLAGNTKEETLGLEREDIFLESQDSKEEDLFLDINHNRIGKTNKNNSRTIPDNLIDRKLNSETGKVIDEKKFGEERLEDKIIEQEVQTRRTNAEKDKTLIGKPKQKEPIFEKTKSHTNTPKPVRENNVNCTLQEQLETPRGDVEKVENEGLKRRLFGESPDTQDVSKNCEKRVPFQVPVPRNFLNLNSEEDEEDEEDKNQEDKMASQSVKANKELWESRETIKKLKDNLLSEQKISEGKERTIQSLKKEMKSLKEELNERKNQSESLDKANVKVLSIETDNRILANQVKMVEEANKILYKELYEAKTKLRSQEGKCEYAMSQNVQMNRRASQILQSSLDNYTGFTTFMHHMETEMISTESALRKFKAQRQALEDLLQEDHEKPKATAKFPFAPSERPRFIDEQVKDLLHSQLEKTLHVHFEDESSKQLHYDERMKELENNLNDCLKNHFKSEADRLSDKQKKIDLARAHVKALKKIEDKFVDVKEKTEELITSKKDAISKEVKELSNELSTLQLEKRQVKTNHRSTRKTSNSEQNSQAVRKNSIEEISDIGRAIRSHGGRMGIENRNTLHSKSAILTAIEV